MESARLFDTTRRSLMEAETLYRQYVQEAWNRLPQDGQLTGFRYTPRGALPLSSAAELPLTSRGNGSHPPLVVPIKLRGEVIGNLVVQNSKAAGWTPEQMELVQAVADRVALSAENARLFDETSRRAERERLVTEITSRIRSTNDPQEMIRTALEELRNALGATDIEIIPQAVPGMPPGEEPGGPARPRGNGASQ
jgi:transcriptional regulator with GAF, ATPase, and Fis domain